MSKKYFMTLITAGAVLFVILAAVLLFFYKDQTNIKAEIGFQGIQRYNEVTDKSVLAELKRCQDQTVIPSRIQGRVVFFRRIIFTSAALKKEYSFDDGKLIDEKNGLVFRLKPDVVIVLDRDFNALGDLVYGEYLPWPEARRLFPRMGRALITDCETGLSFSVQRRAGSSHADVQPLTAADTMTMKKIIGGSWSWRRRAVLVQVGGCRIAASMNGMPHGAGAIRGNQFPGHFCIHFLGSTTHTSGQEDMAHQLMAAKAAGRLEAKIRQAGPRELIAFLYTGMKQQDWQIISRVLHFSDDREMVSLKDRFDQIDDIRDYTISLDKLDTRSDNISIPGSVTWKRNGQPDFTITRQVLILRKDDILNRWYIQAASVQW